MSSSKLNDPAVIKAIEKKLGTKIVYDIQEEFKSSSWKISTTTTTSVDPIRKKAEQSSIQTDSEQEFYQKLSLLKESCEGLSKEIDFKQNLPNAKKHKYTKMLTGFVQTITDIMRKKNGLPIKINQQLKKTLENYANELVVVQELYNQIALAGMCGKGSAIAKFDSALAQASNSDASLGILLGLEPRKIMLKSGETVKEVKVEVPPSEDKIRDLIAKNIRHYLPEIEKRPEPVQPKKEIITKVEIDLISQGHAAFFGIGGQKNYPKALKIYRECDKQGNIDATNCLAQMYLEGTGAPKNLEIAAEYYRKSADAGNAEGLYRMGHMYEKGYIKEGGKAGASELAKAYDYYVKAANAGHVEAITDLGYMYEMGLHVKKDIEQAFAYYTKAAKQKNARALNNLGSLYYEFKLTEKIAGQNYQKAFEYFSESANQGHPKGLAHLGLCFERGHGVESDRAIARELYELSAEKGDPDGKFYLGSYFLKHANETDKHEEYLQAANLFRETIIIDEGHAMANYYLGIMFENGLGMDRDYKTAIRHYNAAARLGYSKAWTKIGNFYMKGLGLGKPDKQAAVLAYEKGAEMNDAECLNNLGVIYEQGNEYITPDHEKAFQYYAKASELGFDKAMLNLGHMFESGKHVDKDAEKAASIFIIAADQGNALARSILLGKNIDRIYQEDRKKLGTSRTGFFLKNIEETKSELFKKQSNVQAHQTIDPVTNVSLRKHVSGKIEELVKSQELARQGELKKSQSTFQAQPDKGTGTITTTKA